MKTPALARKRTGNFFFGRTVTIANLLRPDGDPKAIDTDRKLYARLRKDARDFTEKQRRVCRKEWWQLRRLVTEVAAWSAEQQ